MPAPYTDITILLDRSSSMHAIKSAMESALDEFVLGHRAVETTRLTLVQFDDVNPYEPLFVALRVGDVGKIQIDPRGNTPLLDALCDTLDHTGARLASMPEENRPDRVLFVIITDGQENASKRRTRMEVAARVTRQQTVYKWQFIYLGANQDAFEEAASFGIPAGKAMTYAASAGGTRRASVSVMTNSVAYATRVTDEVPDFTADQRSGAINPDDDDPHSSSVSDR